MEVSIHEAKTHISRLLKMAEDGEVVTIVRRGVPIAQLTPVSPSASRRLGWDEGAVPDSALRPMSDEEAAVFLSGE